MSTTYTYLRETEHPTPEAALHAAFCDIEHNLAHPVEITGEDGDLIYSSEQIGELFVQSNHEPIPAPATPTIRARTITKPRKPGLREWVGNMLYGNPGHWS